MFQALYELLHMNFIVITILVGRTIIRYYGIIFLIILQTQEVWRKKKGTENKTFDHSTHKSEFNVN